MVAFLSPWAPEELSVVVPLAVQGSSLTRAILLAFTFEVSGAKEFYILFSPFHHKTHGLLTARKLAPGHILHFEFKRRLLKGLR
jgi:hypothetical protein